MCLANMKISTKRCRFALALLLLGISCQTASAVVTGQYLLEGTAADTSGFGRDGTLAGGPSFTTGLYKNSNSAVLLNGTSQSVVLPAGADFIRNAPGATLMAWVRLDGGSGNRTIIGVNNGDIAAGGGGGASRATLQVIDGPTFRVLGRQADGGGSSNVTGGTPVIGETYFVAGVFNYAGGAIALYINGQPVASGSPGWSANSADTANLFAEIGSVPTPSATNQEFWPGAIDGARIYNEALGPELIFNIYAAEALAPLIPGDTNGNGVVEAADLTPIRTHYRQTVTSRINGDLTGDMFVDFRDFREWKTAFLNAGGGSLAGLDLSFLSVPEPSAAGLLVVGGLLGWGWRNARKSTIPRID